MLIRILFAIVAAAALAGCSNASPAATQTPAAGSTSTPGLPSLPVETPTPVSAGDGGPRFRIFNGSTLGDEAAPSVELRTTGTDGTTLLTVAPGELSDFVAIPKAQFGDGPANTTIVDTGTPQGETGMSVSLATGDVVTAIVYRQISEKAYVPAVDVVWEVGEPAFGLPWPDVPAGSATLAIFTGPLLSSAGHETLAVATSEGVCLVDATFGEPEDGGFGGTGQTFLILPAGDTELLFNSTPSQCSATAADLGRVSVSAEPGHRVGIIAWAPPLGKVQFVVVDLSGADAGPA